MLNRYLGRRGGFLLLFGIAWLVIGFALQPPPASRPVLFIHEYMPWWLRSVIWFAGALAALICAFLRKPGQDKWGFILLCLPVAVRAVSYFAGVIESFLLENHESLLGTGMSGGVVYTVVIIAIMIVAGWPEPRREVIRTMLNPPPGRLNE